MQATGTLREARLSKGFILVVVAVLCALLLGAAAGYFGRGGSVAPAAGNHSALAADANQGSPDSDRTRALPTAYPDPAAGYGIPDTGLIP
jgi:hypothetical protein